MTNLPDDGFIEVVDLAEKKIEELLMLVADNDYGLKSASIEILLGMGLDRIYTMLEIGVRNDENADLRNGSMELLVRFGSESVPRLIKLLKDSNEEVRNFAAVMLGDIGNRKSVEALIKALSDKDVNVSHSAAEALGKIGDRSALFPLIELLKGDFWVQYSAIAAIGVMRDYRGVPHLLQLLDNELLVGPVIDALGEIGDARALYPLGKILPQVEGVLVGQIARAMMLIYRSVNESLCFKNSLAEYQQPEHLKSVINQQGIAKLRQLLVDNVDDGISAAAVALLGWLEDLTALALFYRLLDNEFFISSVEAAILSIGRSATASLITALEDENDNVKIVALRSLRYFSPLDNPVDFTQLLASPNESLQLEALESVLCFPDRKLLEAVLVLFSTGCEAVQNKSALVLGKYPFLLLEDFVSSLVHSEEKEKRKQGALLLCHLKEEGVSRLLDTLARDADSEVRKIALQAVGNQRMGLALPLISAALADPDVLVRETAVMVLAEFRTPILVDDLLELLGSSEESLDYAVIKALGMMKATTAERELLKYYELDGFSKRLEYVLIETLGRISAKSASEMICSRYLANSDADVRRLAVVTLGRLGDGNSIQAIEKALKDPHWSVRVAALDVLGKLGGVKEIPLVMEAVADVDMMVKKHAILVLGNLRNIATIPVLIKQLNDNEMSKYAFLALLKFGRPVLPWLHLQMMKCHPVEVRVRLIDLIGKVGDQKSVGPLMELLDDNNPEIRLAAIDSLAFCFNSLILKKLTFLKSNDSDEEVKGRAELALKTFTMERYN